MIKRCTIALLLIGFAFLLNSCQTYNIPLDSFMKQFEGMDHLKLREVTCQGPMGDTVKYKTYPIDFIHCVDKNGDPFELKNSPSVQIRFTDENNKKTTFFFDLIVIDSTYVHGIQSRFMPNLMKSIPLNTIKKIEVQDGKMKYSYVK